MAELDNLRQLFLAFRRSDDLAFNRVAEVIVRDLVASNRHAEATALQQILRNGNGSEKKVGLENLKGRSSDRLLVFDERPVPADKVILTKTTQKSIDRLILEHRNKDRLFASGLRPLNKVLFWGPPGCGKTITARMVATELGLPFAVLRLSATITSFVGETASNLQRMFEWASENRSVVLLDEVDALAKQRDDRNEVGELKRVVNSLLQSLDCFQSHHSIIIACSNHQYMLDPAVWRRFDDVVEFPPPGPQERTSFASRFLSGVNVEGDMKRFAQSVNGLSYADIEKILITELKTHVLNRAEKIKITDLINYSRQFKAAQKSARSQR